VEPLANTTDPTPNTPDAVIHEARTPTCALGNRLQLNREHVAEVNTTHRKLKGNADRKKPTTTEVKETAELR
jgi:hypothetical protein